MYGRLFVSTISHPKCMRSLRSYCAVPVFVPKEMPGPKLEGHGMAYNEMQALGAENRRLDALIRLRKEYGDIVRVELPDFPSVILFHPDNIRTVFESAGKFPQRSPTFFGKEPHEETDLAESNGTVWRELRTKLQKNIFAPKEAQAYLPLLAPSVQELSENVTELISRKNGFAIMSVELLMRVLYNRSLNPIQNWEQNPWNDWIDECKEFLPMIVKHARALPEMKPKLREKLRQIRVSIQKKCDELFNESVNNLEALTKGPALPYVVHFMGNNNNEKSFSSNVSSLIIAAVDTTTISLQWLWYSLGKSPRVQEKLRNEIQSVLQGGPMLEHHYSQLPYFKACIKENYRMHPVTPGNNRVLDKNVEVGGYNIPAGVNFEMSAYPYCVDENIFESPQEFIPERWLKENDNENENALKRHPYLILPFGIGPRMCIGSRVAELEIMSLTAGVLQKFEIQIGPGPEPVQETVMFAIPSPEPDYIFKKLVNK